MGQKMYNVTIQGITKQYPEKIPYSEICKGIRRKYGCTCNAGDRKWQAERTA